MPTYVCAATAGRLTPDQKQKLLAVSLRSICLSEILAVNVVEYGRVLLPPGSEDAWFATLPDALRERLRSRSQTKRDLAARRLYADVMQTQPWRPNVGIAELGEDNLFHLGADGLEPVTMVLVEIRRGRSLDRRLELGRRGEEREG